MRIFTSIKVEANQIFLTFLFLLILEIEAKKPPGYVEPPKEIDPDPPKYEYGYKIKDQKAEQGKDEKREGQFSQGSYYVKETEDGTDSKKNIKYFTDDWGFHTIAEYSNKGPNSKSSVTFIPDQEALKYKNNGNIIPDLDPNNNDKAIENDPSNQKTALPKPISPTLPTTPLLTQEQVVVDPSGTILQTNVNNQDPEIQQKVLGDPLPQEHRSVVEDPNQLQFFFIQPQPNIVYAPSALDDQYNQLQQILLQGEILPAPQPLVYNQEPSFALTNDINTPSIIENQVSYQTNIVHSPNTLEPPKIDNHIDFGSKITPIPLGTTKLIESTKHLVSGTDVININESVEDSNSEIETSTLQSLLQHYVTPSLNKEVTHVEINHLGEGFSTTLGPISDNKDSFLSQPIVVADEDSQYPSEKPVVDKNQRSEEPISNTARETLENIESKEPTITDVLVTPRPISVNFLAPMTAGIQLEQSEQLLQNLKDNKENVVVTVQKSIPHYLGKYEYPTAYASAYSGQNFTDFVKEDIELGTTLLQFTEKPPQAERLVQELPKTEQQQIFSDITNNHLNKNQDNHNIYSQSQFYPQEIPEAINKNITKPVERHPQIYPVIENTYVPKFIEKPIEIRLPHPHHLEEKVPYVPIQPKKIPQNHKYPTTLKKQIPWYDQKKHDVYLFQVPKQAFQPNKLQKYWSHGRKHQNVLYTNHYSNYAPQVKNYLPAKQNVNIDRGYLPVRTLNTLEMEHFPNENSPQIIKNLEFNNVQGLLPPITKPWNDENKAQGGLNMYIPVSTGNLGSNNGYLPSLSNSYRVPPVDNYFPSSGNTDEKPLEHQASIKNYFQIKPAHTEPLGLLPPKSSGLRYQHDLVSAPSEANVAGNLRYQQYQSLPQVSHKQVFKKPQIEEHLNYNHKQFFAPVENKNIQARHKGGTVVRDLQFQEGIRYVEGRGNNHQSFGQPQVPDNLRYNYEQPLPFTGQSSNQVFKDLQFAGSIKYHQPLPAVGIQSTQSFKNSEAISAYQALPSNAPSTFKNSKDPSVSQHSPIEFVPQNPSTSRFQQYPALPASSPTINQVFRGNNGPNYQQYEAVKNQNAALGKRSPRSHYFDESSVRMEYGFMPPFKPSQKIREVLEVNPE